MSEVLGSGTLAEWMGSGLVGLWLIPVLQWAKRSQWPLLSWVTKDTARYVSIALAVGTAMGMHFHYDAQTHDWGLTGNVDMMIHGLVQYSTSHWGYKGVQALDALKDISRVLAVIADSKKPSGGAQ